MCGLVAAVSQRDVVPSLVEGLKRLEYRGYDSAGVAALNDSGLKVARAVGKVDRLSERLAAQRVSGSIGIGHTRWATHGEPSVINAHPHVSHDEIAVVHNGIIENHETLRAELIEAGYEFRSETDTEVVAHLIHACSRETDSLQTAVYKASQRLDGTYALAVVSNSHPGKIVAARRGSPLLIGVAEKEHFLASDISAMLPITSYFIALEEGDVAEIRADSVNILDENGKVVVRELSQSKQSSLELNKGLYEHYMQKEIFEQNVVLERTLMPALKDGMVNEEVLGDNAREILSDIEHVHIVACGTSFHAGMVASYTLESLCGVSCKVELASEYRYRRAVVNPNTLFVTLSQSGETADTLAALRFAKRSPYRGTLAICNVPESSLVRESDMTFLTHAGPEIGVASTKAFTTQLMNMSLLAILLARFRGLSRRREQGLVDVLRRAPDQVQRVYALDNEIREVAEKLAESQYSLFLGRGQMYPIAKEGALKLKEISYIYAEAYAAGELKHGPLALVDDQVPVIALAPFNPLLAKVKSNLAEVRARGGRLLVLADKDSGFRNSDRETVLTVPKSGGLISPIVYTVPLQLLAYYTALYRGTNVDQPRNLAKSVTVE